MLMTIERVKSIGSTEQVLVEERVNPEAIERVRESGQHQGRDCVDVLVHGEWVRCLGTVQQVGHTVNELALAQVSEQ